MLEGLDGGRHADTEDVEWQEVSGLMVTAMFAAFTPEHVDTQEVAGFDGGRFETANAPAVAPPAGLERTDQDAAGSREAGQFAGSARVDGLEASPSVSRIEKLRTTADAGLPKVVCRCGEAHRLPRCPACGTSHPDQR